MTVAGMFKRVVRAQRRKTIRRRAPPRRPTRLPSRAIMRRQALGVLETKKKQVDITEVATSTLGGYTVTDSQMILDQGDGYATFEGHIVRSVGTSFRYMFHNSAAQTIVMRYIIAANKMGAADTSYVTGTALFDTNGGNLDIASATEGQKTFARINRDKYYVYVDRTVTLAPNGTDRSDTFQCKHWINQKLALHRQDGTGARPTRNNLFFACWCAQGNLDTSLGSQVEVTGMSVYYFKDV